MDNKEKDAILAKYLAKQFELTEGNFIPTDTLENYLKVYAQLTKQNYTDVEHQLYRLKAYTMVLIFVQDIKSKRAGYHFSKENFNTNFTLSMGVPQTTI